MRVGGGIEGDAERLLEAFREHRSFSGRSARAVRPKDSHAPRSALGDENVAVRRNANHTRDRKTLSEEID
jgi:hypothetical protein